MTDLDLAFCEAIFGGVKPTCDITLEPFVCGDTLPIRGWF